MNLLSFSVLCNTLAVVLAIIIAIVTYYIWSYSYWKRKNLQFIKPTFFHGTMDNPLCNPKSLGQVIKENYNEFKRRGLKHGGIYNFSSPCYMPVDPEYVKNIMQTDFQYFTERGTYYNEKSDPLSAHLFALGGTRWRKLRVKLTPTFTSGKMKQIFETLVQCTEPLKNIVDVITENHQSLDINELVSRYTTDVIGSCAFGLDCNSFKNPDAEFRKCGKQILERSHLFNIRVFDKNSTDFFFKVVKDTVNYRKTSNVKRNDFLQLLIDMKTDGTKEEKDNEHLSIEVIAAQCLLFFLAGFETSSATMTFCLFELAKNQTLQNKVRDEINDVLSKHNGKITYDSIMSMKYMTQTIEETLRKYPPVPNISRKCVKDYRVPDTDLVLEKGTPVFISIYGLQSDPEVYPEPEIFDPDRFSEQNKKNRHQFSYIPFGEGPRLCIGLRFGMMQVKVGLTVLLKNYIFSLNEKTPSTLTVNPKRLILFTNESILLDSKPVV